VADPQQLVVVTRNGVVSTPYPLFANFRDHAQALDGVLAFRTTAFRITDHGETERVTGCVVSGTYFDVLGVKMLVGTPIAPEDDQKPGSGGWRGPVVVLSHSFWLRRFGGQPSIIGTRILLNDHPFTISGVAPPGFSGTEIGEPSDVFAPMMMQEVLLPGLGPSLALTRSQWLRILGRLKPGTGVRQAEAELTTLLRRYNEENFGTQTLSDTRRRSLAEQAITLEPGSGGISQLRKQYSKPLWVLIAIVAVVLLIACANVANLLVSRATARRREIAIRLSLGAARSRLVCQVLTESLILSAAGAAFGLLLALWMRDLLMRYLPNDRSLNAPIEASVLLFTLLLCVGAALFFGVAPALQSTAVDVMPALKGGSTGARPSRVLLRKSLVVFQMGLSFLLLIAAALFLRSLHNLLTIDPGFAREQILVASVESGPGLDARLLPEMRSLPGVISAGLSDSPPLRTNTQWPIYVPGSVPRANETREDPSVGFISPGYFATMGIPLLVGRDIDEHDYAATREVMVVNETFARYYFAGENPVGKHVGTKEGAYPWEIIGVVKDGKYSGLREGPTRMMYVPARPGPWSSGMVVHLRTAGSPAALASVLRQKVRELDKSAALFHVETVREEVDQSLLQERLVGTITGAFGALALALAAIGLYGLMSYGVVRRTREFGIRIAVGAKSGSIVKLVVGEAAWLLAGGMTIGFAASWALGRLVKSLLFEIEPADPLSRAIAMGVLAVAAMAAAWIPARRASRVDPLRALGRE